MRQLLWLDDIRSPFVGDWVNRYSPIGSDGITINWVKNYKEFIGWITANGLPDAICFDHDLGIEGGIEMNGYHCAKWLVEYCLAHNLDIPKYRVHSSNPVGRDSIISYMETYHKIYIKNNGDENNEI